MSEEFAPGMVFRNRHVPKYTVTLIRPSGVSPGWWLVEPARGQSHGQYVYAEESLRNHFDHVPRARCNNRRNDAK
jgi:hypothetical protein